MPIKMPTYTQLSAEQREILEEHDLDENLLVVGPPGTGKTVIAMHRAEQMALARKDGSHTDKSVRMIMYNKVLQRYSGSWQSPVFARHVDVRTYHSFATMLWQKAGGVRFPPSRSKSDVFDIDWPMVGATIRRAQVQLGPIVIDEAQDLPPIFFEELSKAMLIEDRVGVSIFADENQTLKDGLNSGINDIETSFGHLSTLSRCALTENYRNTLEIAELARRFYAGLPTGMPKPPTRRRGERPRLVAYRNSSTGMIDALVTYARNNPSASVLVVLPSIRLLKSWYSTLARRLAGRSVGAFVSSAQDPRFSAENMAVGDDGSITLVHWQSMKGLEADAVFVPHLEEFDLGGDSSRHERMRLYVMCSRARMTLELQYDHAHSSNSLVSSVRSAAEGAIECQTR
jgi:DNA helicase IV